MKNKIGIIILSISVFMITYGLFSNRKINVKFIDKYNNINYQEVEIGNYVVKPKNPIKSGYKFLGWYNNDVLFDFTSKIFTDINLIARWEKIK